MLAGATVPYRVPSVDLLVLASSRKGGGRCIAGCDLNTGSWVRPISDAHEGTVLLEHCAIDGEWPQVYDVVRLEISEPRPSPWQPENWGIAPSAWQILERLDPSSIADELQSLVNEDVRILDGSGRKISSQALTAEPIHASLTLVRPTALRWRIERTPWGTRQQKANFEVDGSSWFDLQVTDPHIEERLATLPEGSHPRSAVGIDDASDVLLTLSLSEPYERNGDCYKLVAAVLELPARAL